MPLVIFILQWRDLWYNVSNYNYVQIQIKRRQGNNMQNNDRDIAADRLATASMILGIISLVSILCCCPFVFSAIGIILALLSKGAEETLRPRAKTGLVLSITGMIVSFVLVAFSIVFPLVMYRTNPEFRKNFNKSYRESLEQDEELFRQLYGDEVYDQMKELFPDEEDSL